LSSYNPSTKLHGKSMKKKCQRPTTIYGENGGSWFNFSTEY
jgi:hypothetical protein